jgi:hypothetical protein
MILLAELLISCTWMTAFVRAAFSTIAPVSSVCSGERWAESCQPVGPFCFSCECIHEIRSRSKTKATRRLLLVNYGIYSKCNLVSIIWFIFSDPLNHRIFPPR